MFFRFVFLILSSMPAWSQTSTEGKQLFVPEAQASSFLQSNWNKYQENYHPNYAFDKNPKTAWVEGVEGDGQGQSLTWPVSKLEEASKVMLKIQNGYQKSKSLFAANAVPKKVKITLFDKGGKEFHHQDFELKKEMGWQEVQLSSPRPEEGLSKISLTVLETYPGKTYKDTCISDIQTFVVSKVPYDEAAEKQKFKDLQEWTKERLKTAAYFAKLPASYPGEGTRFSSAVSESLSFEETSECDMKPRPTVAEILKPGTKLLNPQSKLSGSKAIERTKDMVASVQNLLKEKTLYKLSFSGAAQSWTSPDFNYEQPLHEVMKFLSASEINYFEANQTVASIEKTETSQKAVSNAKISFFDPEKKKIQFLSYWVKDSGQERAVWETLTYWAFQYDESGKLIRFAHWTPKKTVTPGDKAYPNFQVKPDLWKIDTNLGTDMFFAELRYGPQNKFNQVERFRLSDSEYDCGYASGSYNVWTSANSAMASR